jgi:hypothetical protein
LLHALRHRSLSLLQTLVIICEELLLHSCTSDGELL